MKASVIIPAYNEETTIRDVVRGLPADFEVIVVDDGSTDNTPALAAEAGAIVVSHAGNVGYCAAIRSGLDICTCSDVITIDSDGQHDPKDAVRLLEILQTTGNSLVLGVRYRGHRRADIYDKVAERMFSLLVWLKSGRWLNDCSCGLKAFKKQLAESVRQTSPREGWHQLMCLTALKSGMGVAEVPVKAASRTGGTSRVRVKRIRFFAKVVWQIIRYTLPERRPSE